MHLSRTSISTIVVIVVALWALYLYFVEGIPLNWQYARPYSVVLAGLIGLGFWFEKQLWRLPPICRLVKLPDIRGTWEAELHSSYKRPGETDPIPPIRCFLPIEQSYSTLRLGLLTPESSSALIAHNILPAEIGDGYQIVGVYRDEPKVAFRERSEIHRGALILRTHGSAIKPNMLTGEYWTDRNTSGSIKLMRKVNKIFTDFDEAAAAFSES